MHPHVALTLLPAAAAAGWIDAVVGGGGLVQLPALLVALPGIPTASALGTNKLASIAGTSTAAVTYLRRTKVNWRMLGPAAGLAVFSAGLGAACASAVPSGLLRPLIMAMLVAVALFVSLRPDFGTLPNHAVATPARTRAAILVAGGVIGCYDGLLGPGTGTFLILSLIGLIGLDFVQASASAKVINAGTNLGALIVFASHDHVLWLVGLGMAACNTVGARLGARMALRRGARFVRVMLVLVVIALVIRLALTG